MSAYLAARPLEIQSAGHERYWGAPGFIAPDEVTLLRQCRSYASLQDHAVALCQKFGLGTEQESSMVDRLCELRDRGWMVGTEGWAAPATEADPVPISTLAVLSCNRGATLSRGLRDWSPACQERGVRCLVSDDGQDARRGTPAAAAPGHWIHAQHRRRWVQSLPDEHWRSVAAWGLFVDQPPQAEITMGAALNAVLLATVGERIISCDDDVCLPILRAPHWAEQGWGLASAHEPTELLLFDAAKDVPAYGQAVAHSPFTLHESVVGRRVAELLAPAPYRIEAGFEASAGEALRSQGRVRVSMLGMAGDSGMSSPAWYLSLEGEAGERLDAHFPQRILSRQVLRAAPRPRISRSQFLMNPCIGLDNRELLPPLLPLSRAADSLFAKCLMRLCPSAFIGYLPYAVTHLPPEARSYQREHLHSELRPAAPVDILMRAIDQWQPEGFLTNDAERFTSLAEHLSSLSRLPRATYLEWHQGTAAARSVQHLLWLQSLLDRATPVRQATLVEMLGAARHRIEMVNRDRKQIFPQAYGAADFQQFLGKFGELLALWPALHDYARSHPLVGEDWQF